MTAVALQQRVRSHQRKSIEVLLDVLHRNSPASHVVAVFAVRSELPAVNIGVAIRAFRAGVAEYQVSVALAARDSFVHAAQRKLGVIVIKFGNVANRLPRGKGMAVLTGEIQVSVRAARGGVSGALRWRGVCLPLLGHRCSRSAQQKPNRQIDQQSRAQGIPLVSLCSHEIQLAIGVAITWPSRVAKI
jgi:hypothetical protein